ncbi:hypothetical protein HYO55_20690 [Vibrio parahaemolyticus]|uniref:hypothetical protein n=1 Tax=Vibrio parahaemolyticus TaxID=670 RepID=UPI0015B5C472|nr:hypothetical protein [Vibrio parahaemolyticus]MBM4841521.1 hypothetical protein [Vibrio parahaemolyticus]NWJ64447.1 hypothetical protein [Vibrio parahaemolyticus]NWK15661.1 hypothetical protein [Vibrio parahaemolyticus]
MDSLNNIDFKKLASQQKSIQMKMRPLTLAHFKDGHSHTQIAKFLKAEPVSISRLKPFLKKSWKDGKKAKNRKTTILNFRAKRAVEPMHKR